MNQHPEVSCIIEWIDQKEIRYWNERSCNTNIKIPISTAIQISLQWNLCVCISSLFITAAGTEISTMVVQDLSFQIMNIIKRKGTKTYRIFWMNEYCLFCYCPLIGHPEVSCIIEWIDQKEIRYWNERSCNTNIKIPISTAIQISLQWNLCVCISSLFITAAGTEISTMVVQDLSFQIMNIIKRKGTKTYRIFWMNEYCLFCYCPLIGHPEVSCIIEWIDQKEIRYWNERSCNTNVKSLYQLLFKLACSETYVYVSQVYS
jgi:Zn-finger protein